MISFAASRALVAFNSVDFSRLPKDYLDLTPYLKHTTDQALESYQALDPRVNYSEEDPPLVFVLIRDKLDQLWLMYRDCPLFQPGKAFNLLSAYHIQAIYLGNITEMTTKNLRKTVIASYKLQRRHLKLSQLLLEVQVKQHPEYHGHIPLSKNKAEGRYLTPTEKVEYNGFLGIVENLRAKLQAKDSLHYPTLVKALRSYSAAHYRITMETLAVE